MFAKLNVQWIFFAFPVAIGLFLLLKYGTQLVDDGYYYLQIAWHIAHGHGFTFDGIHLTNGFHPLWQLVLVPFFWFFEEKSIVTYLVSVLQLLLYALSGWLIYRAVYRQTYKESVALFAMAMMLLNIWFFFKGAMTGMETAIVLLLLGTALIKLNDSQNEVLRFGIILMLLVAARLEMVVFVVAISFLMPVYLRQTKTVYAGLFTALYLSACFFINKIFFDHPFPISGTIKTYRGRERLLEFLTGESTRFWDHLSENLTALLTLNKFDIKIGLFLLFLFLIYYIWIYFHATTRMRLFILIILGTTMAMVLSYSALYGNVLEIWKYYWLPVLYLNIFLFSCSLTLLASSLRRVLMLCFVGLTLVFSWIYFKDMKRTILFQISHSEHPRHKMVAYINQNLPEHAILGSWDAGYLGYYCQRTLINLDGLVNNYEIIPYLRNKNMDAYIDKNGIDYLVNQNLNLDNDRWRLLHTESIKIPAAHKLTTFSVNTRYIDVATKYDIEYNLYKKIKKNNAGRQ
jgi:hypothetical protein